MQIVKSTGFSIMIILAFLIMPAPLHAAEASWFFRDYQIADEWGWQDTSLELAHTALGLVDWYQTRRIAASDGRWHEHNPLLGPHPTVAQVDAYSLACFILHPIVSAALPRPYRTWWQVLSIGLEVGCVSVNYHIGIR